MKHPRALLFSLAASTAVGCTDEGEGLNAPPTADPGPDQIVGLGELVVLDATASRDPDGEITSFLWVQSAGPGVELESSGGPSGRFTSPVEPAKLEFSLVVTDDDGAVGRAVARVEVRDNERPVANAGPDLDVPEGIRVELDGRGSTDPDGEIRTYAWAQIRGTTVTLDAGAPGVASFISPFTAPDELAFTLTVMDDDGRTDEDEVRIQVVPNLPPVADAGEDQVVTTDARVTLDGTSSRDPDGELIEYRWRQVSGPGVSLDGADEATSTFTMPANAGVLEFELTVVDDQGEQASDVAAVVAGGTPPELRVTFPTPGGDFEGDRQNTVVSGWVEDPDRSGMQSVSVNGELADLDLEIEGRWSVMVPIGNGRTSLEVVATDLANESTRVETWVQNQPSLHRPQGIAYDPDTGRLLVLDFESGFVEVDLATGDRFRRYGSSQAPFGQAFAVDVDWSAGVAYASDLQRNIIVQLDLDRGTTRIVTGQDVGAGAPLDRPGDLRVDPSSGRLYVLNQGTGDLLEVDIGTGQRTTVRRGLSAALYLDIDFGEQRGAAVGTSVIYDFDLDTDRFLRIDERELDLTGFFGVVLRAADNELWLARDGVVAFDLESFDFEPLSSPPPGLRRGLRPISSTELISAGTNEVVRIDVAMGTQAAAARVQGLGTGEPLTRVRDTAWDARNRELYAIDGNNADPSGTRLLRVDPDSGDRDRVAFLPGTRLGASGVDVDPDGRRAVVVAERPSSVSVVDLSTGAFFVTTSSVGGRRVLIQPDGRRAYMTAPVGSPGAVFDVDLETGSFVEFSGPDRGDGVTFNVPLAVAYADPTPGGDVYVGDFPVLWRVDSSTGDREIVFGRGVGQGVNVASLGHLAPDPQDADRLFIADNSFGLIAFDRPSVTARVIDEIVGMNGFEVDPTERRAYTFRANPDGVSSSLLTIDLRTGQTVVSAR